MSGQDESGRQNIHAEENSVAVGSISIGGSVDGNITIGNTGYTATEVMALIQKITSTFQAKPFDGTCPYKGLDVFEEDDAELFFGREKLVDDLVSRVKESRTVFITGPSGSGKSSLVRAGLIPALKQGQIKGSECWLYATMKPGRDPLEALGRAVSHLAGTTNAEDEIRAKGMKDASIFTRWCEILLKDGREKRVVLFIDQFEEVFTQVSKEEERIAFLDLLTQAADAENGRVILLFSMRSDFVPNCAVYPKLNATLNRQFIQIGGMQPDELVSAIAQPALRVGLRIDPDLIAQIINDMKGEPGALPLMSFALKDLFNKEQTKGGVIALTLSGYLENKGISEALQRHADAALAQLSEHEKKLAQSIFSNLIAIGRGTQDTKRTAPFSELVPADSKADEVQAVVQKLADARLVTTEEYSDEYTITHEKLIDAWPWLKKLINENREAITLQNEIARAAKEWEGNKSDNSYLFTGGRLVSAREKLELKKLILSDLAQRFIQAGIDLEDSIAQNTEIRRQKELDDAQKLVKAAQLQARAEKRSRTIISGLLAVAIISAIWLFQSRTKILLQEASTSSLVLNQENFQSGSYMLGDQHGDINSPDSFLAYKEYTMPSFSIDPLPVTNRRYGLCIQAGRCTPPLDPQSSYKLVANLDKPVVYVTVMQAVEFCNWIGMNLPDDKEWELAASSKAFKSIITAGDTPASEIFYEWTRSLYSQNSKELTDNSIQPDDVLTLKEGELDKTIATYREAAYATFASSKIGFRCVKHP